MLQVLSSKSIKSSWNFSLETTSKLFPFCVQPLPKCIIFVWREGKTNLDAESTFDQIIEFSHEVKNVLSMPKTFKNYQVIYEQYLTLYDVILNYES